MLVLHPCRDLLSPTASPRRVATNHLLKTQMVRIMGWTKTAMTRLMTSQRHGNQYHHGHKVWTKLVIMIPLQVCLSCQLAFSFGCLVYTSLKKKLIITFVCFFLPRSQFGSGHHEAVLQSSRFAYILWNDWAAKVGEHLLQEQTALLQAHKLSCVALSTSTWSLLIIFRFIFILGFVKMVLNVESIHLSELFCNALLKHSHATLAILVVFVSIVYSGSYNLNQRQSCVTFPLTYIVQIMSLNYIHPFKNKSC